jgi:hypothetical protein
LLAARALHKSGETERLKGLVLLAPAIDFTEVLLFEKMPASARTELLENGVWFHTSAHEPSRTPITRQLRAPSSSSWRRNSCPCSRPYFARHAGQVCSLDPCDGLGRKNYLGARKPYPYQTWRSSPLPRGGFGEPLSGGRRDRMAIYLRAEPYSAIDTVSFSYTVVATCPLAKDYPVQDSANFQASSATAESAKETGRSACGVRSSTTSLNSFVSEF